MTEPTQAADHHVSADRIEALVLDIARALVDQPQAVTLQVLTEPTGTTLRLRVAPGDIGKIIGKQGRTARSLRTILGAAGMKLQHRFTLDILEDDVGRAV